MLPKLHRHNRHDHQSYDDSNLENERIACATCGSVVTRDTSNFSGLFNNADTTTIACSFADSVERAVSDYQLAWKKVGRPVPGRNTYSQTSADLFLIDLLIRESSRINSSRSCDRFGQVAAKGRNNYVAHKLSFSF
jgi:polyferredoxin